MKPVPRFKWDKDNTSHWRRWSTYSLIPPAPIISLQRTSDVTKRKGFLMLPNRHLPIDFQRTAFRCPGRAAYLLHTTGNTNLRFEFSDTKTCGVWHGKSTGHPSGEGVGNSSLKFNLSFETGNRKSTVKPVLADLVAQWVSNVSFHILKKKQERSRGMGNSGIHTNKP